MQLDLVERLTLLGTLPEKKDIVTIKILRKLRESLAPTEQEIEEFGLHGTDWQIVAGQGSAEIEMSETQRRIIVDALQETNRKEQITLQHISLWEKFCEDGKE